MAIKIFIDQGHNPKGPNTGSVGNGLNEADVTYRVGELLKQYLLNNGSFQVMMARKSPDEIIGTSNSTSLIRRVQMANEWGADYYISLHTNAVANPQANGSEIFTYRLSGPAYSLARIILRNIVVNLNMRDRGVKEGNTLYVLRRTKMPALLIELGFISNKSDAYKLDTNPEGFAYSIYQGILEGV